MRYEEFIKQVSERAGKIPKDEAATVTTATLRTLGDRITGGEARDLAAQLPQQLQAPLREAADQAEQFDLEQFVQRVSERARVARDEGRDGINAVFQTLQEAVTFGEFEDVFAQLPDEFQKLAKPVIVPGPP